MEILSPEGVFATQLFFTNLVLIFCFAWADETIAYRVYKHNSLIDKMIVSAWVYLTMVSVPVWVLYLLWRG